MWNAVSFPVLQSSGGEREGRTTNEVAEYCCPWDTGLYQCIWRGSAPDCAGATCKMHEDGKDLFEVQVDSHGAGSSWNTCSYGRQKALCCQVRVAIPEPLECTIDSCDIDTALCSQTNYDEWGNYVYPAEDVQRSPPTRQSATRTFGGMSGMTPTASPLDYRPSR